MSAPAIRPRILIADDEPLLRAELRECLAALWPEAEVVGEAADGIEAVRMAQQLAPDVAFLDIRMPGLTGLEVAGALAEASPRTRVVFVTAYDQYAIDAFDKGAVDYLLKPVARARLAATVQRLKARITLGQRGAHDAAVLAELVARLGQAIPNTSKEPPLVWLTASAGLETRLIMVEDIAYFQSDTKYTVVMTAAGEALLRKPIRELLDVLDPAIFKQIHRSTIVNLRAVASIQRDETGRGIVKLKTRPETLSVSQPFMSLFRNM